MATNVAVGILRPSHIFFYEIDYFDKNFIFFAKIYFDKLAIFRTKHGYHLIAFPYKRKYWKHFKYYFPSDYTKKLKPRFGKRNPQILRISEKWDMKTGKVTSPKPKLIYGNFFLQGIQNYKVLYYAK